MTDESLTQVFTISVRSRSATDVRASAALVTKFKNLLQRNAISHYVGELT
jgi:hypothetical protein